MEEVFDDGQSSIGVTEVKPTAIPIVVPDENAENHYKLDEDLLKKTIRDNGVEDLPAVVVSVAGAFRKGKSFLLNFFLRYLSAQDKEDWVADKTQHLEGFSWRGGSDRDTTGILLWSKIFRLELKGGKEVAVLLMDTQGSFDGESSVKECVTIFALSTMVSSVQVYNLSGQIQEDDLQHLALFTDYGRLAAEESEHKPFQSLQFLVRDWSYPYEYDWGEEGGEKLLTKKLMASKSKHEDLRKVREHIDSCFDDLSCYLMPHPGFSVSNNRNFKGALKDMEPDFQEHISKFVPYLFDPERLQVKSINGHEVTCKQIVDYFVSYMNVYNCDDLPQPRSMLQATAEVNNSTVMTNCREFYVSEMDKLCKQKQSHMQPAALKQKHEEITQAAIAKFDSTRKLGGNEFAEQYREQLKKEVMQLFEGYEASNDKKIMSMNNRAPMVIIVCTFVFYFLSVFFSLLYLPNVSTCFYTLAIATVLLLFFYVYCRFTGNNQEAYQYLSTYSDICYVKVLVPAFQFLVYLWAVKNPGKVKTN